MPSYRCKWPTCCAWVNPRPGYCPAHADKAPAANADRHQNYDEHHRDEEAKRFYDSAAWRRVRISKLAEQPVCEGCGRDWSTDVHHNIPARESVALRLEPSNLVALCGRCHKRIEAERSAAQRRGEDK